MLRFHSLALREEGSRSTIHFALEDDLVVARCRAIIDERPGGAIVVGPPLGYRGAIDGDAFAAAVERLFRDQLAVVERLGVASCIVALGDRELVIDEGRIAAGM